MLKAMGDIAEAGRQSARDLKFRMGLVTGATLGAIILFVVLGNGIVPSANQPASDFSDQMLTTAFLLNIALILFGWMRSKELRHALELNAEAERRARQVEQRDYVTGLLNRSELVKAIEALAVNEHAQATILLLDLDHFKNVNDLYGHATGDRLLASVAQMLKDSVDAKACCARLGGDEFAILLPGSRAPELVTDIAAEILEKLSEPIVLEETRAHISASIGIARFGEDCRSCAALLRHADIAMYEAKRLGRNCFAWFDVALERQLQSRNRLEAEMREGIGRGEFVPFYQPLINLESNELIGFEVLARWHHPERGLLEPADFIPVAESSFLISTLSLNVMRQALVEARKWPAHTILAVNVSPVQFKDPLLAQRILQLLTETGFPPQRLEVELTESTLLEDQEIALATVQSLKNSGISISLDDFGTGYASLTQFKSLPFDRIKIDRSFVTALFDDEQSTAIVNTIANLGQSLRLPITAEGVESESVREQLQSIGCSDAQGWLFGKAIPASAVRKMLDGGTEDTGPGMQPVTNPNKRRRPAA